MAFDYLKIFSSTTILVGCFLIQSLYCAPAALASSPVAVLRSAYNQQEYQEQHLGNFDDNWQAVVRTLGAANISFEEISDTEAALGQQRIGGYRVIIIPELIDLPISAVSALEQYQKLGGKIIITDAGGTPENGAKRLEQLAGVSITKQITTTEKRKIDWSNGQEKLGNDEFPIGSVLTDFTYNGDSSIIAHWQDLSGKDLAQR